MKKNPFSIRSLKTGRLKKKPVKQSNWLKKLNTKFIRYLGLGIVTVLLSILTYYIQEEGIYFKASILETPASFDGTVAPIAKVPNWTTWKGDHYTAHFSGIPASDLIPLPPYDISTLQFPDSNLVWGNTEHDKIRNAKITYSVVYMGSYKLDHTEHTGSHLAVDIRTPKGTPIRAIANGKVTLVSNQSSGFGHHIVIKHSNVPDPDNPDKRTTLYSSYVHMDELHVKEGQVVKKGQQIGTSGNTGTSTTPHLHFQIDKDTAPWHPYWPFTWADSQAAGLSFFEAVNAGLGKAKAIEHTINPMQYVSKYIGFNGDTGSDNPDRDSDSGGSTDDPGIETDPDDPPAPEADNKTPSDGPAPVEDTENEEAPTDTPSPVEVIEEDDINESSNVDTSLFEFKLVGETASMTNNGVLITAIDEKSQIENMSDSDRLHVKLSGVGTLSKKVFEKEDFVNNAIKFIVKSSEAGTATLLVGKSSMQISFVDEVKFISRLKIKHDGYFQKNVRETIEILAIDEDGNITPAVNYTGVINVILKEGEADISRESLQPVHFKNGIATVTLTPKSDDRIVIRAQNGAIVGESDPIFNEPVQLFSDVPRSHANYQAIKYLADQSIVNGYSDGTFKPEKTVNRVEALKMLMLAFDIEDDRSQDVGFSDTDKNAWYISTLATAVAKGIVNGYPDGSFKPGNVVNKAEYLKILFKTAGIEPTVEVSANPYPDVPKDAWYAPFAYLTNLKNLLDVPNNRLEAATGMTRGDVAETIYRLKYINDNNLVTYNK